MQLWSTRQQRNSAISLLNNVTQSRGNWYCSIRHVHSYFLTIRETTVRILTPWSRVFQNLERERLVKLFPAFCKTQTDITAFATSYFWTLYSTISNNPHVVFLQDPFSIVFPQKSGLPDGLFLSTSQIIYEFSSSQHVLHLIRFDFLTKIQFGEV